MPLLWAYPFIALLFFASESTGTLLDKDLPFPTPQRPIRIIFSDIDGTLTGSDRKFVEANIEGFNLARSLGIQVAFVTGRDPLGAAQLIGKETMQKLGYSGTPGIYMDGTYAVNENGEAVVDAPFDPEVEKRLLTSYKEKGMKNIKLGVAPEKTGMNPPANGSAKRKHYTVYVTESSALIDKVRPVVEEDFRGKLEFTRCHANTLGCHSAGFNKGTAVKLLAADMGISTEEVLVMGDAENDLPMFGIAAISVAVGNAQDAVKKVADYITVDSNEGALLAVVREIEKAGAYPGASAAASDAE